MAFLSTASFVYLATLELVGMIVLAAWSLCFYFFCPIVRQPSKIRWVLPMLITITLGYLAYFKYIPRIIASFSEEPLLQNVVLPLGISYYTFKLIHYAVETARDNIKKHSLSDFLCYIFLVPIFTAGPIERFDHFLDNCSKTITTVDAVEGATRVIHGLIKKLVLAELVLLPLFGGVTDGAILLERLSELPTYKVWGFCVLAFLLMYLDFSAYSDLAIGTSRLFGIRIMENFNWPILASNIGAFWQRWHMTLAKWAQSYVYFPLIGITRNPYVAMYFSFSVIGLWHSASVGWLAWGLYHATGVSIFGYWQRFRRRRKWAGLDTRNRRLISLLITFSFVSAGAVFTTLAEIAGLYEMIRVFAKLVFIDISV
jgi:alginate O-acetyltransferase complex protein AlgI